MAAGVVADGVVSERVTETVLMVAGGEVVGGLPRTSGLVAAQADAVRAQGWEVAWGLIDDRASPRGVARNLVRLRRLVADVQPRVVHAQYGSMTAALASAVKQGAPLVVSFCGDDLLGTPEPGWRWRVREKVAVGLGLAAAATARRIVVKSRNLLAALPAPLRRRAVVLPNGVDLEAFRPLARAECRRRLGWHDDEPVILFNASERDNQPVKNPALARAAVERLRDGVPAARLQPMGGLDRAGVVDMLCAADCLLVTSLHEGSPNIVKEAMACDLPVVSVPCGDVAERLDGVTPGGVYRYDAEALAAGLAAALGAGRRSNGRDRLRAQGLDAAGVARRLVELYRSAEAA